MRLERTLGKWNDDHGFGFISPKDGAPKVFAHISAFPRDGRRAAGRSPFPSIVKPVA